MKISRYKLLVRIVPEIRTAEVLLLLYLDFALNFLHSARYFILLEQTHLHIFLSNSFTG